jgi:sRNA-binding carbon storage regulator CsrA
MKFNEIKHGLLLTRKRGQAFFVTVNGKKIKVTVEGMTPTYTKLRIQAPDEMIITREELEEPFAMVE